jgi:hypothetical protein
MPPDIRTIAVSSSPPRIFIAIKDEVQVYPIQIDAKQCSSLDKKNVDKIRVQQSLIIVSSNTVITGWQFETNEKGNVWVPKFAYTGKNIKDGVLVCQSKLIVISQEKVHLAWEIYNYSEIISQRKDEINKKQFKARFNWSPKDFSSPTEISVLDTSSRGLCFLSSHKSDIYILNLMKEGDDPASGWAGKSRENNYGGFGCFLRPCGIDGHQPPFLFCGYKYAELAISQQLPDQEETHEPGGCSKFGFLDGWQGNTWDNDTNPVFSTVCHYSGGFASVWNSQITKTREDPISAVLLFDYAEREGNCRFYRTSAYNQGDNEGYYVMGL